jgi:hypothetical protein
MNLDESGLRPTTWGHARARNSGMRLRNSGNNDKKKQKRRVPQIFSRISECNCAFAHVGKREMGSVGEDRNAIVVLESFQATAVGVQCRVALRLVGSRLHRFQPQMDMTNERSYNTSTQARSKACMKCMGDVRLMKKTLRKDRATER